MKNRENRRKHEKAGLTISGLNNFTSNVNTSTPSVTNTYTNCLFNMAAMAVFTNCFHIQ